MLVERGCELEYEATGEPERGICPLVDDLSKDAMVASMLEDTIEDVFEWLGFEAFDDYLTTLPKEKADIFKRATY